MRRQFFDAVTLLGLLVALCLGHGCVLPMAAALGQGAAGAIGAAASAQSATQNSQQRTPQAQYTGYSQQFQTTKACLMKGQTQQIIETYAKEDQKLHEGCQTEEEFRDKLGLLGFLERGSVALAVGSPDGCINYVSKAEEIIEERDKESLAKEKATKAGAVAAELVGIGDQGRYFGNGFERVMMLNVKSMAYLLDGDLRAYNVTRLAITWQDEEREKFQRILEESSKEQTVEEASLEDKDAPIPGPDQAGQTDAAKQAPGPKIAFLETITTEFAKYDAKALEVQSAYVNPFGHYLAGVVQEFRSLKDPSLKSNALIAYQEALQLNPNSPVIQAVVAELGGPPTEQAAPKKKGKAASKKAKPPKTEGLLQVVAFDGFVPEKKVLSMGIRLPSSVVNIKVPVYDTVPNQVSALRLTNSKGAPLAELTTVADMEALCLRHQKDSVPLMYAGMMASGMRDMFLKELLGKTFGNLGGAVADGVSKALNPDTRSWMSLPSSIKAARLPLPKGTKEVNLVSYDKNGKVLATKSIKLNGTPNNFVFARSMDQVLYVQAGKPINLGN